MVTEFCFESLCDQFPWHTSGCRLILFVCSIERGSLLSSLFLLFLLSLSAGDCYLPLVMGPRIQIGLFSACFTALLCFGCRDVLLPATTVLVDQWIRWPGGVCCVTLEISMSYFDRIGRIVECTLWTRKAKGYSAGYRFVGFGKMGYMLLLSIAADITDFLTSRDVFVLMLTANGGTLLILVKLCKQTTSASFLHPDFR